MAHKLYNYRPDVDGLRALAVFAVFVFHAFPGAMRGGFVGVDVFFVISGFLISSIIFRQLESNTFSFWNFYSRRIRRIYPVLVTVLSVCLIFGLFYLLSDEYAQLGKHVAGGAGFISNFLLWFESGYFDRAAETKPLLHLWSLGIEEQFYIIWPLLLWLSWKKRFNLFVVCAVLATISFGLNLCFYKVAPEADFFSPQTRFWELLAGAMLAWISMYPDRLSFLKGRLFSRTGAGIAATGAQQAGKRHHALSLVGALLLVLSVFFIKVTASRNYPGIWALFPVLAAVLLIAAGKDGWFNKYVLSNRLLVWFGLISYPLYLWHWPILSFVQIVYGEKYPAWVGFAAFPVTVLLAWLTTRLVENPLRFGEYGNLKTLFLFVAMLLVGVAGFSVYKKDGAVSSFNENEFIRQEKAFKAYFSEKQRRGSLQCDAIFPDWPHKDVLTCWLQRPVGENTLAVVGDSHAGHLYAGLIEEAGENEGIAVFPVGGAAPFIDVTTATRLLPEIRDTAYLTHKRTYDYIVSRPEIKAVVLAHYPPASYQDAIDRQNPGEKNYLKVLENGMRRTFDMLEKAGKKVFVVLDNPQLPYAPRQCMSPFFSRMTGGNICSYDRSYYDENKAFANYRNLVLAVSKDYPCVSVVDLSELFCDSERCYIVRDGKMFYQDTNHLNFTGSMYVAPYLMQIIRKNISASGDTGR